VVHPIVRPVPPPAGILLDRVHQRHDRRSHPAFRLPDIIFTSGGIFHLIKPKLVCLYVPRLVGMIIGIAAVAGMILK